LTEVFAFFSRAENLERLTPPFLRFEITTKGPIEIRPGTLIDYKIRLHGVPIRWRTRIESFEPLVRFVDVQLRGPYRLWHHTHEFEARGDATLVRDRVRWALPFGPLGDLARRLFVARDLDRIFAYRRETIDRLFAG
jgi:ligand-binding SRPBCC domain-containing protein